MTIATPIIDKNGKHTTVHINPDKRRNKSSGRLSTKQAIPSRPIEEIAKDAGWDIAPEGYSGRACPNCGEYWKSEEIDEMWKNVVFGQASCVHCGEASDAESCPTAVRWDAVKYFDETVVRQETWYHATVDADWYETITDEPDNLPMVHIGTLDAAIARAQQMNWYADEDMGWHIYSIKINPEAVIAPSVLHDEDSHCPNVENDTDRSQHGYELQGVTRYVNRYEGEGSISLVINPKAFTVQESETFEDVAERIGLLKNPRKNQVA